MKLSIQNHGITNRLGPDRGYRLIADSGFEGIDRRLNVHLSNAKVAKAKELRGLCIFEKPLDEMLEFFAPELNAIKKYGLEITQAHAPFAHYVHGRPEATEYYIEIYKNIIRLCHAVGCKTLVIHGCVNNPDFGMTPEQNFDLNMYAYSSLIDTLKDTDVTVCLENLFFYTYVGDPSNKIVSRVNEACCVDPREAVEYIDRLNAMAGKECFGLCVDTGHLMLLGKSFAQYMPVVGNRVKALHIHDNDGRLDRHLAPFTGVTDWREFVSSLRGIGYEGDLSFETFAQVNAERMDEDLVPLFVKHIAALGNYFRDKISASR